LNRSSLASVPFPYDFTAFESGDEFGLGGEDGAVVGGEELFVAFEDGVLDEDSTKVNQRSQVGGLIRRGLPA
jgi:hypothetical protein